MVEEKFILLVEDNPDDVELTLRAFSKNRILNRVIVVKDGAEALDFLFAAGDYADRDINIKPTVILLDLQLPKVHGLEVLKRIKSDKRLQLIPVVILTSSKEEFDMVQGYSLGANSFIRKPVDFLQFNEAVKNLGLYWVVLNETN
jgi:CheY-like chemotaxis protein